MMIVVWVGYYCVFGMCYLCDVVGGYVDYVNEGGLCCEYVEFVEVVYWGEVGFWFVFDDFGQGVWVECWYLVVL